jgi:hypothetical protein
MRMTCLSHSPPNTQPLSCNVYKVQTQKWANLPEERRNHCLCVSKRDQNGWLNMVDYDVKLITVNYTGLGVCVCEGWALSFPSVEYEGRLRPDRVRNSHVVRCFCIGNPGNIYMDRYVVAEPILELRSWSCVEMYAEMGNDLLRRLFLFCCLLFSCTVHSAFLHSAHVEMQTGEQNYSSSNPFPSL